LQLAHCQGGTAAGGELDLDPDGPVVDRNADERVVGPFDLRRREGLVHERLRDEVLHGNGG